MTDREGENITKGKSERNVWNVFTIYKIKVKIAWVELIWAEYCSSFAVTISFYVYK